MSANVIFDNEKSKTTSRQVEVFPWIRFDAEKFIYEEALIDGNYVGVYFSAMGRAETREKHISKYRNPDRYYKNHFLSFELEVDGQLLKNCWKLEDVLNEKLPRAIVKSVVVLSCLIRKIKVEIHTLMDGSSFLERWLNVLNEDDEPIAISKISPWSGIVFNEDDMTIINHEEYSFQLGRYKNTSWSMEGEFRWEKLPDEGSLKLECNKTSRFGPSYYLVKNNDTGEILVIDFEYSGGICVEFSNYNMNYMRYNRPPWKGNYLHVKVGLAGSAPFYVLNPHESAASPKVHFSMLYGDIDTCSNELFLHLRKSVIPRPINNPFQYCHDGYSHCNTMTEQMIMKEIDMASEIGAEMFIVDPSWNGEVDKMYVETFGDWYESPKLNGRLINCFDYARSKSMKCGLWLPIEIILPTTKAYAEHPDWCLTDGDRVVTQLDITKPEVENYMMETVISFVEKYKLDCIRIDGGPEYFCTWNKNNGKYIENTVWKYYDKWYGLLERIKIRYPDLHMLNCWGGGGRSDLGMMRHFHCTQISDNFHPRDILRALNGMTLAIPPEQCMFFSGSFNMNPADLDFSFRIGLFGQYLMTGISLTPDKYNEIVLDRCKHSINIYKNFMRPMLSSCLVYHHTPLQDYGKRGDWVVLEYVDKERSSAAVGVFRLDSDDSEYLFISKGLDISLDYEVQFDNLNKSVMISGLQLRTSGVLIGIPGNMMSELLLIHPAAAAKRSS